MIRIKKYWLPTMFLPTGMCGLATEVGKEPVEIESITCSVSRMEHGDILKHGRMPAVFSLGLAPDLHSPA